MLNEIERSRNKNSIDNKRSASAAGISGALPMKKPRSKERLQKTAGFHAVSSSLLNVPL
ncbi:hypothetical protein PO124_03080 [Bacillus licheniformis]|nr:hypothetical protein [Bacillus licheniformis]